MATYEEIYGKRVKEFDSDPTLDSSYEGQVWYNSGSGVLKSVVTSFAFRSTTSLPSGRDYGTGGGATQNASWAAGGEEGSTQINTTYDYNGSGWTQSGNMGDARIRMALGNMGPQTAGLGVGGYSPGIVSGVEEYDGSTWTGGQSLPGALQQAGGAGPQTANIILGGGNPTTSLSYNGSSWSSEGSSSEAFAYYGLAGANSEACLAFYGAEGPPGTNRTTGEEYNGTSWTTVVGTLPNQGNSGGATGTVTSAIFAGNSTTVRSYDGTSITLEPAMTQSRGNGYIGGTSTSGITSGGSAPGSTANCEEFDKSINTITAAAWAAGGTVPYASRQNMSFGTQTAAIACGGHPPGNLNTSVSYDGTSYSSTPNLNSAARIGGVAGTQAAGYEYGGIQPPGTYNVNTQTWNGSSWSNSPYNLNNGTYGMMSCGTSTAALSAGGEDPGGSPWNVTEEYDGEGWTSGNTMPVSRYYGAGDGTQTSAFIAAGSAPVNTTTLEYDGTNWTTGGSLITNTGAGAGASGENSDSGLVFGGSPAVAVTQGYDGTSWSTRPSLATGRGFTTGNGTATAGLIVSGGPPSGTSTATEEFTGETETVTSKTLTTS
jgi:hypothetical protein